MPFKLGSILILMKSSEFKISHSVESYHKKIVENCRNIYDAEKHIASKLSMISIPNFSNTINQRLESRVCQNFMSLLSYHSTFVNILHTAKFETKF